MSYAIDKKAVASEIHLLGDSSVFKIMDKPSDKKQDYYSGYHEKQSLFLGTFQLVLASISLTFLVYVALAPQAKGGEKEKSTESHVWTVQTWPYFFMSVIFFLCGILGLAASRAKTMFTILGYLVMSVVSIAVCCISFLFSYGYQLLGAYNSGGEQGIGLNTLMAIVFSFCTGLFFISALWSLLITSITQCKKHRNSDNTELMTKLQLVLSGFVKAQVNTNEGTTLSSEELPLYGAQFKPLLANAPSKSRISLATEAVEDVDERRRPFVYPNTLDRNTMCFIKRQCSVNSRNVTARTDNQDNIPSSPDALPWCDAFTMNEDCIDAGVYPNLHVHDMKSTDSGIYPNIHVHDRKTVDSGIYPNQYVHDRKTADSGLYPSFHIQNKNTAVILEGEH